MHFFDLFSIDDLGQSWIQVDKLILAFALSSLIGLEREKKLKSAGLRTHALVGLGAALMMLVSKYGFTDVIRLEHVALDPSRVAAQIVSGIGFIGGGLIFVRKDIVHGLTTAATVWLTAGIGMACGGGLPILALAATLGHFIVVYGYSRVIGKVVGSAYRLNIRYRLDSEAASKVLDACRKQGFAVRSFAVKGDPADQTVSGMVLRVQGRAPDGVLVDKLMKVPGVLLVTLHHIEGGE